MTIPHRGETGSGTYFITAPTSGKRPLLQSDRMARLFIETLLDYRGQGKFELHEFVVMPDHFHVLITPNVTLERAIQFIKGGFSYRDGRAFNMRGIWQQSFYDRRVRDAAEYAAFRNYIHQNPVKRGLAANPEEYLYGSASGHFSLDPPPQRLKPESLGAPQRSAEALLHP